MQCFWSNQNSHSVASSVMLEHGFFKAKLKMITWIILHGRGFKIFPDNFRPGWDFVLKVFFLNSYCCFWVEFIKLNHINAMMNDDNSPKRTACFSFCFLGKKSFSWVAERQTTWHMVLYSWLIIRSECRGKFSPLRTGWQKKQMKFICHVQGGDIQEVLFIGCGWDCVPAGEYFPLNVTSMV